MKFISEIYTKDRSKLSVFLLSLICFFSTVSKIPFLDQLILFKIISFFMPLWLFLVVSKFIKINIYYFSVVFFIFLILFIKYIFGFYNANLFLGQNFFSSVEGARFSFFIFLFLPFLIFFVKSKTHSVFLFSKYYTFILLSADTIIFIFFIVSDETVLQLGQRTGQRFLISALPAIAGIMAVAFRHFQTQSTRYNRKSLFLLTLLLAHTVLFTTSRAESILVLAAIAVMLSIDFPKWRFLFAFAGLAAILIVFIQVATTGAGLARNYDEAIELAAANLPFGVGYTRDSVLRSTLGSAVSFYVSDYGLITYLIRFGVFGYAMVVGILALLIWSATRWHVVPGSMALFLGLTLYAIYIPFLEYSTVPGAFVLAILLVPLEAAERTAPKHF